MHSSDTAKVAFLWIVDILHKRDIPFQITGGMAAKVYGSPRDLNDIDIEIPNDRLAEIVPDVRPYIEFGPERFIDERWDTDLLMLNVHGQLIDIAGAYDVRICDARDGVWKDSSADLSTSETHEVCGIRVPVVDRKFLADYKQMLAGEHQAVDIEAIRNSTL